ncbi:TPA: dynamin family protein [Vibrio parahaemolyticus]|nr:dynamin family protein [Vibrio parahaemolyticus]
MDSIYSQQFNEIEIIKTLNSVLEKQQSRWFKSEQKLSIGIMGQVKAGKSSFLNALLFDGKPILPEAATPKTANLTRISYGEQYTLKVDYYSKQEWGEIHELAAMQSQSVEVKVAKELVSMASSIDKIELERCLTLNTEIIIAKSLDGLQGILNQYTGNDGSHTPLVKSTEILLPIDELNGFEVVDTPGMNDPVASRTQRTREYMANCDVVFFLSRASQFLDKADEDLLRNQLPNKGVKRLVVVAGQFDSAIIDDGYDRDSLDETLSNLYKRLTRQSRNKAEEIVASKIDLNDTQSQMVIDSLSNPVFASTFAYGYAHWEESSWTESMKHSYNEITEIAEDEWDYEFTHGDWLKIGNFGELTKHFEQARTERKKILDEQKRSYLPDAYNALIREYNRLEDSIEQRISLLKTKEVADIEAEQVTYEKNAIALASILSFTLTKSKNEAKQQAQELLIQLEHDQTSFTQIATRTGTREEEYSYQVSTSRWYNPFSWGSSRTVYRTRTVSYEYLSAHDAIEQVNAYGRESARQIVNIFSKLISPNELKFKLKTALLSELDTRSENFEPMVFKSLLESFISKLALPDFDIELGDTTSVIASNFNGEITSTTDMNLLKEHLSVSLANILKLIQSEFEVQFNQVLSTLESAGDGLEDDLTANLQAELAKLKQQIFDKENEIAGYKDYLVQVSTEKASIEKKLTAL